MPFIEKGLWFLMKIIGKTVESGSLNIKMYIGCFGRTHWAQILVLVMLLSMAAHASETGIEIRSFPLERNGVQLFLQRYRLPDDADGRQILLVHGLTFSSHEFDLDFKDYSLARFFARAGYSVWLLDIAGYGRSGAVQNGFMPDSEYASRDIGAAVDRILEESGAEAVDMLGWSWGSITSSRFAARHPEKIGSLVLYAPIVAGLGEREIREQFTVEAWMSASDDFQRGGDGQIDPAITERGVVRLFEQNIEQYDGRPVPNGGRRDLFVSPDKRLLPVTQLTCPVLLIVGDRDEYVTVALVREAAAMIAESDLTIIPGGGHALMLEKPHYTVFRDRILEFLTALQPASSQ